MAPYLSDAADTSDIRECQKAAVRRDDNGASDERDREEERFASNTTALEEDPEV